MFISNYRMDTCYICLPGGKTTVNPYTARAPSILGALNCNEIPGQVMQNSLAGWTKEFYGIPESQSQGVILCCTICGVNQEVRHKSLFPPGYHSFSIQYLLFFQDCFSLYDSRLVPAPVGVLDLRHVHRALWSVKHPLESLILKHLPATGVDLLIL